MIGLLAAGASLGIGMAGWFAPAEARLSAMLGADSLPFAAAWIQYTLMAVLGLAVAWATVDIVRVSLKLVVAGAVLAELLVAVLVAREFGWFVSPFPAGTAAVIALLLGLAYGLTADGKRKALLRAAIGRRVSDGVFRELLDSSDPLPLSGEERTVTVLVARIAEADAALPPVEYVRAVNRFLAVSSRALLAEGAWLERCDEGMVRAVFGAPLPDSEHAASACAAAIELLREIDAENQRQGAFGERPLQVQIGIETGEVTIGLFGTRQETALGITGEAPKFARDLCKGNATYGSRAAIGPEVYFAANDFIEVRPLDLLEGDSPRDRIEIYELIGMADAISDEAFQARDLYWSGVIYFREQRWVEARTAFEQAVPADREDPVIAIFLRRLEEEVALDTSENSNGGSLAS